MPFYKCVGGPNDGQYVKLPDNAKDVMLPSPSAIAHGIQTTIGDFCEDAATITRTRYTARRLCSVNADCWNNLAVFLAPDDRTVHNVVIFLAPDDWTDRRAVQHQFTK